MIISCDGFKKKTTRWAFLPSLLHWLLAIDEFILNLYKITPYGLLLNRIQKASFIKMWTRNNLTRHNVETGPCLVSKFFDDMRKNPNLKFTRRNFQSQASIGSVSPWLEEVPDESFLRFISSREKINVSCPMLVVCLITVSKTYQTPAVYCRQSTGKRA